MKIAGIKCKKCGDYVFSFHRHDYRWCKCGAVAIDGGIEYTKFTGDPNDMEVFTDEIGKYIQPIRHRFEWTSIFDKDNNKLDKPVKRLLRDIDTTHLLSIIKYFIESGKISNLLSINIILEELLFRVGSQELED